MDDCCGGASTISVRGLALNSTLEVSPNDFLANRSMGLKAAVCLNRSGWMSRDMSNSRESAGRIICLNDSYRGISLEEDDEEDDEELEDECNDEDDNEELLEEDTTCIPCLHKYAYMERYVQKNTTDSSMNQ
jgi:hypothetical protein